MNENEEENQALIPIEQDTITFNNKPLVVVRLPDGQPGVVLRWICENLNLGAGDQVQRIKRTEVIADDLVYVRVQTDGGPQVMPTLVLNSVPYWLATIDTRRMEKDDPKRLEILSYQRKAVAALYEWAQSTRRISETATIVPSEPIPEPTRPEPGASLEEWIEYHQQMLAVLEWQRDIGEWQGEVESRLESLEEVTSLIPEILDRLPPVTLTPAHQNLVKYYVSQLSKATNKPYGTIYSSLYTAFSVPRYQDLPESEWENVERWFKSQLDQKRKR